MTASGRRKRKDTGAAREKGRGWSEDEERLFNEALGIHGACLDILTTSRRLKYACTCLPTLFSCMAAGRDWKACAAHVGTRDSRAIASHAQKHFVKLCINGQALPVKVAESGTGYTLSGKPLDPESAAAKAYGFKAGILERERLFSCLWQHAYHICRSHDQSKHMHALGAGLRNTCGASLAGIMMDSGEQAADKENGVSANAGTAAAESTPSAVPAHLQRLDMMQSSQMAAL